MPEPVVTVRGEAQLEGPPDLAGLSVALHASADSVQRVRASLAEGATAITALVSQYAAALESQHTAGLHVAPVFNRRTPGKVTGYTGSYSHQFSVRDFEALSPLVLALTALPNGQLDGPWWSLKADNPLYRQVRIDAILAARRRAEDYAAAVGMSLGELLEVSDLDSGFGGPERFGRAFAMAKDAGGEPSFDFEPAVQTVSGAVTVRYLLVGPG